MKVEHDNIAYSLLAWKLSRGLALKLDLKTSLDLKRGEVSGNVLTGVGETQMRAVKCHRALQGMLEHRVIQQNKKNKKGIKAFPNTDFLAEQSCF